jgi:hypothetical protein
MPSDCWKYSRDDDPETSKQNKASDVKLMDQFFGGLGTIENFTIVSNGHAAIIRFATQEEAWQVIATMNGQTLPGGSSPIIVIPAKENPNESSNARLPARSSPYVTQRSTKVPNGSVGYGAVKQRATEWAGPTPGKQPLIAGHPLVAKLKEWSVIPDGAKKEAGISVFGLPSDMDELNVYRMFAPFGSISGIETQRKVSVKSATGVSICASVNFILEEAAQAAKDTYDGMDFPDGTSLRVVRVGRVSAGAD